MIHIIGAGGIGGWLARLLRKTVKHNNITIWDKDVWEAKNLDRQLLSTSDIGMAKAVTLCRDLGLPEANARVQWFMESERVGVGDQVFVCVDNHPARAAALAVADASRAAFVITCGNELTSASAFIYYPKWRDSKLDPRVRYPELLTSKAGDPTTPCTGEYQEANRQLAIANFMAAGYGMQLFWFWQNEYKQLTMREAQLCAPVEFTSSASDIRTLTVKDIENA